MISPVWDEWMCEPSGSVTFRPFDVARRFVRGVLTTKKWLLAPESRMALRSLLDCVVDAFANWMGVRVV